MREFKVGDKLWVRDTNNRVYGEDGRCIEEHFWKQETILRVGRVNIELQYKRVLDRETLRPKMHWPGFDFACQTDQEKEDFMVIEKRWQLLDAIRECKDANKLRAVQDLLENRHSRDKEVGKKVIALFESVDPNAEVDICDVYDDVSRIVRLSRAR